MRSVASGRRAKMMSSTCSSRLGFGDVLVDDQLAGVHDPHVHARLDGVEEEGRVDRLAHRVVAPEGEGEVRDAAAHPRAGAGLLDGPRGLDEVERVAVVLLDSGRDGEDVRIEDDVLEASKPASSTSSR